MWVDLQTGQQAHSDEGVGGDDRGGAGDQAPERVRAVAGEFHLVGDLLEGGLYRDALHSAMIFRRTGGIRWRWPLAGGRSTAVPRPGLAGGERLCR